MSSLVIEFARGGSRRGRNEYESLPKFNNIPRPPRFSRPKRTENRLLVENLSLDVSWQVRYTVHSLQEGPWGETSYG